MNCLLCNNSNFDLLIDKSRNGGNDKNYICKNCGFISIQPRPDNTFHEKEYKDGGFSVTARGMTKPSKYMTRISNWQANNRLKILEDFTGPIRNKKVLDVGCGAGNFLKLVKDKECNVTGLEPDFVYTESNEVNIVNEFLENYTTDNKYDLLTSFHVIEHVENPNLFLQKCRDLLKDDGLLYLECPSIDRIYGDTVDYFFWYAHLNTFSKNTLSAFLFKNGFEILKLGWNKDFVSVIAKKTDDLLDPKVYYETDIGVIKNRVKNYNSSLKPKIRKVLRNLRIFKNKIKKLLFNID